MFMYSNVITITNSVHFVYLLFLKLQIDSQSRHFYEIIVCNLAKNTVFKLVKRRNGRPHVLSDNAMMCGQQKHAPMQSSTLVLGQWR